MQSKAKMNFKSFLKKQIAFLEVGEGHNPSIGDLCSGLLQNNIQNSGVEKSLASWYIETQISPSVSEQVLSPLSFRGQHEGKH